MRPAVTCDVERRVRGGEARGLRHLGLTRSQRGLARGEGRCRAARTLRRSEDLLLGGGCGQAQRLPQLLKVHIGLFLCSCCGEGRVIRLFGGALQGVDLPGRDALVGRLDPVARDDALAHAPRDPRHRHEPVAGLGGAQLERRQADRLAVFAGRELRGHQPVHRRRPAAEPADMLQPVADHLDRPPGILAALNPGAETPARCSGTSPAAGRRPSARSRPRHRPAHR